MLYQQEMKLPVDAELCSDDNDGDNYSDTIIDVLLQSREKMFCKAKCNILDAQEKQKKIYDRKHAPEDYPVGTAVLVENTADKQRKGGKLNSTWMGPYRVSRVIGKGVYELTNKSGSVVRNKVNASRLKLYIERSNEARDKPSKRKGGDDNDDEVVLNQKRQCLDKTGGDTSADGERVVDYTQPGIAISILILQC